MASKLSFQPLADLVWMMVEVYYDSDFVFLKIVRWDISSWWLVVRHLCMNIIGYWLVGLFIIWIFVKGWYIDAAFSVAAPQLKPVVWFWPWIPSAWFIHVLCDCICAQSCDCMWVFGHRRNGVRICFCALWSKHYFLVITPTLDHNEAPEDDWVAQVKSKEFIVMCPNSIWSTS